MRLRRWWRKRQVQRVRDLRPCDIGRQVQLFPPMFHHLLTEGELTRVEHYAPDKVQLGIGQPRSHADEPWDGWICCRLL